MKKSIVFLIISFISLSSHIYGIDENIDFRFLEIPNVYNARIFEIAQDSIGFIWILTNKDGVYKFDGVNYEKYKSINRPRRMIISNDNSIIISCIDGIHKFNKLENKFEKISNCRGITAIKFINSDEIILTKTDSLKNIGIYKLNINTKISIEMFDDIKGNDFIILDNGDYFILSGKGLIHIDKNHPQKLNYINNKSCKSIIQDKTNSEILWYGLNENLVKYNYKTKEEELFPLQSKNNRILDLDFINKNEMLISSVKGLLKFNVNNKIIENISNSYNMQGYVLNTLVDNSNTIWLSTINGVIKSFPGNRIKQYYKQRENKLQFVDNFVRNMCVNDTGDVWFITKKNDLNLLNAKNNEITEFKLFSKMNFKPSVRSIFDDNNGNIWIATNKGLFLFSKKNNHLEKIFQDGLTPVFIRQFSKNSIFVGNYRNIYEVDLIKMDYKVFDIKNVLDIEKINDDWFWILTNKEGIRKYNFKSNEIVNLVSKKMLLEKMNNHVNDNFNYLRLKSIEYYEEKKELLISTKNDGLFIYNEDQDSIYFYNKNNGLWSNKVLGFQKDINNNMWINTSNGILLYKKNKFKTLSIDKGFNCYKITKVNKLNRYNQWDNNLIVLGKDNELFVGGRNGINSFNPDEIFTKSKFATLVLRSIEVFGEKRFRLEVAKQSKTFKFSHNDDIITFNFAALNYQYIEKNRYSFLLEKFNKNWEESKKNYITFKNLDPGKYTLKTKYSDFTGTWWDGSEYEIIITPPFWQTYIFYIVLSLLIGIIVFIIIKIKTITMKAQNEALEYRILQSTKELNTKKIELEKINLKLEDLVRLRTEKLSISNEQLLDEILKKEQLYFELHETHLTIELNLKQQTLLSQVSMSFISLENFYEKIANALELVGEELELSSVFLFEDKHHIDKDSDVLQWVEKDKYKKFQKFDYQRLTDWLSVLHSNDMILLNDFRDIDQDLREELEQFEIKSFFTLPLIVNEQFYGFIGCDIREKSIEWSESIINLFKTIAYIIGNAFERKIFQLQLLESEKTSKALLNASDSFAVLYDIYGKIKLTNTNFLKVVQKNLDEVVDTFIIDYFPKSAISKRIQFYKMCIENQVQVQFEDEYDGQIYNNNMNPIKDMNGNIHRVAHFSHNITKQKKAENILKEHQEELQKEVDERTKELRFTNNELIKEIEIREKVEADLKKSEKLKRENLKRLALQLAHEIKNPLSSINSSAQLVETIQQISPDVESTIRHMKRITNNVDTCNRVIKELYEFTHDASLQIEKTSIESICSELIEFADSLIGEKKIELKNVKKVSEFYFSIDKFRIMQALKNIIANSIDSIDKKGEIKIIFNVLDKKLLIEISDTGKGMSDEILRKIYVPFFTSKSKGFGLGMAIVKKIIERHNGTLFVKSKIGIGTTTKIEIPEFIKVDGDIDE